MTAAPSSSTVDAPIRSLRSSLASRLVGVTLLAAILLGGIIFLETRGLLTNAVETRLVDLQHSQARAIASGLNALGATVAVIAADEGTSDALAEFSSAFTTLDARSEPLSPDEQQALERYYEATYDQAAIDAGLTPPTELVPSGAAARYLQLHYIVENPHTPDERSRLVEADGDSSPYRAAHETHHPQLLETWAGDFADLLLVDEDGNIVYSAMKRSDLGRNLDSEFLGDGLGDEINRRLAAAAIGEAVFVDFRPYTPASGSPTLFAAAAVSGSEGSIGAVVVEVPIATLNRLTTMSGEWRRAGLGDTGEVYVVGRDLLMRSDSRLWLEDEAGYLEAVEAGRYGDVAAAIARVGTTVLQQPVDTLAVQSALDGEPFFGEVDDYLGRSTLASAERVDTRRFDWVVVAQISTSETGRSMASYVRRILLTAAILVPAVGLFGIALAGRFTRPFAPIVAAASRVAGGDLDVEVPDFGRNELGDVARRVEDLAGSIRGLEAAIAEERAETKRLLLSALPARIVEGMVDGSVDVDDLVDSATIVAIFVRGLVEASSIDSDTAAELSARVSRELEGLAERHGLERMRSSADQHLFVAGLGLPTTDVDRGAELALEARSVLGRFADETGVDIEYGVGISSGNVIAGLIDADQITYGVFGDPPRIAIALASRAAAGQILVDDETAGDLGGDWLVDPATDDAGHARILSGRSEESLSQDGPPSDDR